MRIACVKLDASTKNIDSYRCLNLKEYLKVYNSLRTQSAAVKKDQEKVEESEAKSVDSKVTDATDLLGKKNTKDGKDFLENVVRIRSYTVGYRQDTVKMHSKCIQDIVKIQSKSSQNAVETQSKCRQNSVQKAKVQSKYSQNAIKIQPKFSQNAGKYQSKFLEVLID